MKQNKQVTRQSGNVSKMIAKCLAFSAPICAMAAEGEKTQNSETEGGNNKLLMGVCLAAAAGIAYKVIG
jgi:hypothetical protein